MHCCVLWPPHRGIARSIKALITLLSQALSVSRNALRIQHGTRTRTKFVEIESLSASDVPGPSGDIAEVATAACR